MYKIKANAKVNLFLHITGRNKDKTHNILSLICFAKDIYDTIWIEESKCINSVKYLNNEYKFKDDLVKKVLSFLSLHTKKFFSVKINKETPIAAGLGGGSCDAGAVINYVANYCKLDFSTKKKIAFNIGADVAVCMHGKSCIVSGIGDQIHDLKNFAKMSALFVNPAKPLSTKVVFDSYRQNNKQFSKKNEPFDLSKLSINELLNLNNDLQYYATKLMPEIHNILLAIARQSGCNIAKMSGSGATCFGIFKTKEDAQIAALKIKAENPSYFVKQSTIF